MRPSLPAPHAAFLAFAIPRIAADARLVGVAAGGSYLTDTLDEFSDLDLVIAVAPEAYETVLADRQALAAELGPLLAAFTGEHVGEPRLLICLFGPPLLHVDLKFVREDDLAVRVEDPAVLWERDGRMRAALLAGSARYPDPDPQWIEDRFWIWVHYVAAKVGRGEILEAADALASIRGLTFGPMALASRGARPMGVRKLERVAPDLAVRLARTVAACEAPSCLVALRHAIDCYREFRDGAAVPTLRRRTEAEEAAVAYVDALVAAREEG
jgi:predicted nucleotidyltransferase